MCFPLLCILPGRRRLRPVPGLAAVLLRGRGVIVIGIRLRRFAPPVLVLGSGLRCRLVLCGWIEFRSKLGEERAQGFAAKLYVEEFFDLRADGGVAISLDFDLRVAIPV